MPNSKLKSCKPDVVLIYQDRETVTGAIKQIADLNLNFQSFAFKVNKVKDLIALKPKVLLLSSNSIASTIKFYVDFLEKYNTDIAPHSSVLLINNREASRAYSACESGLFDNYAVINPLNEVYRLKLVLMQSLELIEVRSNENIAQLAAQGEEELAECINHGVDLKKSISLQLTHCEESITSAADQNISNTASKEAIKQVVEHTFNKLSNDISNQIQSVIEQMVDVKFAQNLISTELSQQEQKSTVNRGRATATEPVLSSITAKVYKILVAESDAKHTNVFKDISEAEGFCCKIASGGQDTLIQYEEFKPDLVVIAYDLPQINGIEVTRMLRACNNKVPIIAYSHHKDKSFVKTWIPLGISNYLVKPSTPEVITEAIYAAIKQPVDILSPSTDATKQSIKWLPEYSVGHTLLDGQHKMLFSFINDFFHSSGKESVVILFNKLTSYIGLHFKAEEDVLREIKYPAIKQHIKQHQALINKIRLMEKKLENYNEDIHFKIGIFLYHWLTKHILKEDMDYSKYAVKEKLIDFCEAK